MPEAVPHGRTVIGVLARNRERPQAQPLPSRAADRSPIEQPLQDGLSGTLAAGHHGIIGSPRLWRAGAAQSRSPLCAHPTARPSPLDAAGPASTGGALTSPHEGGVHKKQSPAPLVALLRLRLHCREHLGPAPLRRASGRTGSKLSQPGRSAPLGRATTHRGINPQNAVQNGPAVMVRLACARPFRRQERLQAPALSVRHTI